jgi:phosphoglycolate phosphatase-like HAD superfamily hydrolase
MKPNPENVIHAVEKLAVEPGASVFVGDTVSDVEASLRAGVHPIGYAKNAERARALVDAGAEVVIESMAALL